MHCVQSRCVDLLCQYWLLRTQTGAQRKYWQSGPLIFCSCLQYIFWLFWITKSTACSQELNRDNLRTFSRVFFWYLFSFDYLWMATRWRVQRKWRITIWNWHLCRPFWNWVEFSFFWRDFLWMATQWCVQRKWRMTIWSWRLYCRFLNWIDFFLVFGLIFWRRSGVCRGWQSETGHCVVVCWIQLTVRGFFVWLVPDTVARAKEMENDNLKLASV